MKTERYLFLEWHFNQFKQLSCDGLDDADSKNLYERVYSHNHQDLIRTMEFNAWLSSASREGYKLVPLEPSEAMLEALQVGFKPDYEGGSYDSCEGYKAMMGVGE